MTTKEMAGVHAALLGGFALYMHPDKIREMLVENLANEESWKHLYHTHKIAQSIGLVNDPEDREPPDELEVHRR